MMDAPLLTSMPFSKLLTLLSFGYPFVRSATFNSECPSDTSPTTPTLQTMKIHHNLFKTGEDSR